jgi:hypothetical protein
MYRTYFCLWLLSRYVVVERGISKARSVSAIRKRSRDYINKDVHTVFLREILSILFHPGEQKCSAEYSRNNGIFFDFLHLSVVAVCNVSNLNK